MDNFENIDLLKIVAIAKEAGQRILEIYHRQAINVTEKGDGSPLTEADLASHQYICQQLVNFYPDIPIISEESAEKIEYQQRKNYSLLWLIDPLDGTKEFIKRNDEFTVNIALIRQHQPVLGVVYAPALDLLYYAKQDEGAFVCHQGEIKKLPVIKSSISNKKLRVVVSRSHLSDETSEYLEKFKAKGYKVELVKCGSSLKICWVAEGKADLYPRLAPTMEWDTAAAHAILKEVMRDMNCFERDQPLLYNKPNMLNPWFIVNNV